MNYYKAKGINDNYLPDYQIEAYEFYTSKRTIIKWKRKKIFM